MVRSTLLQLPLRGALWAFLGGPLVTVFFRLQTKVLHIKKGSRNKVFVVHWVSNHEKSDGVHHFLVGPRHLSGRDDILAHFCHILVPKHEKWRQSEARRITNQNQSNIIAQGCPRRHKIYYFWSRLKNENFRPRGPLRPWKTSKICSSAALPRNINTIIILLIINSVSYTHLTLPTSDLV